MAEYIEYIRIDDEYKQVRDVDALHEQDILERLYPVGSLYLTLNSVNPTAFLGGVWERVEGRFLLGAGTAYPANSTGGSANATIPTHTHSATVTVDSNGEHIHNITGTAASGGAHTHAMGTRWSNGTGSQSAYVASSKRRAVALNTSSAGIHTHNVTGTAASGGAHTHSGSVSVANTGVSGTGKNMPPYLAVYIWKRTA